MEGIKGVRQRELCPQVGRRGDGDKMSKDVYVYVCVHVCVCVCVLCVCVFCVCVCCVCVCVVCVCCRQIRPTFGSLKIDNPSAEV
jgi:hypothetical protein